MRKFFWLLFSFGGRTGPGGYLLGSLMALLVLMAIVGAEAAILEHFYGRRRYSGQPLPDWAVFVAVVPFFWVKAAAAVKRAHDLGHSGWIALGLLIPLVNIGMALYFLFGRSAPQDNQWGPARYKAAAEDEVEKVQAAKEQLRSQA